MDFALYVVASFIGAAVAEFLWRYKLNDLYNKRYPDDAVPGSIKVMYFDGAKWVDATGFEIEMVPDGQKVEVVEDVYDLDKCLYELEEDEDEDGCEDDGDYSDEDNSDEARIPF